jgi:hypothetical protein
MYKQIIKGAAIFSFCCCTASASATEYVYKYTGLPFTSVNQPFTTLDAINFSFTTTALLGNNMVDQSPLAPIQSWFLTLGPLSYSSANSVLYSINFSTNAIGKITGYQFTTQTNVVAPGLLAAGYPPSQYVEEIFSWDFSPAIGGVGVADGIYIPSIFPNSYYASNSGTPGSWTVSEVPEPLPAAMLMAGLGLISFIVRCKKYASPKWV